jgi:transcriptional regulator with XRE-family HTH domain
MEENFGEYLKGLRLKQELSTRQLSTISNVSHGYLSQIETGKRNVPKPEVLQKLADPLKTTYETLMIAAGYINKDKELENTPSWATTKDKRDFKVMLEEDGDLMFDGVPIEGEDRQRIKDVLTGLFWEAKQMNKRKKKTNNMNDTKN